MRPLLSSPFSIFLFSLQSALYTIRRSLAFDNDPAVGQISGRCSRLEVNLMRRSPTSIALTLSLVGVALIAFLISPCSPAEVGRAVGRNPETAKEAKAHPAGLPAAPVGRWCSCLAPKYPLVVARGPAGLSIRWAPTMDSDIRIEGVLKEKGSGEYSGTVRYSAGDASGERLLTLRFDPAARRLSMEFKVMWTYPVEFRPAEGPDGRPCDEAGCQ